MFHVPGCRESRCTGLHTDLLSREIVRPVRVDFMTMGVFPGSHVMRRTAGANREQCGADAQNYGYENSMTRSFLLIVLIPAAASQAARRYARRALCAPAPIRNPAA